MRIVKETFPERGVTDTKIILQIKSLLTKTVHGENLYQNICPIKLRGNSWRLTKTYFPVNLFQVHS
jgi:hypothetical protein